MFISVISPYFPYSIVVQLNFPFKGAGQIVWGDTLRKHVFGYNFVIFWAIDLKFCQNGANVCFFLSCKFQDDPTFLST